MLGVRFDSFHGTSLLLGIDGCSVIRHNTNSWGSCFVWKKKINSISYFSDTPNKEPIYVSCS